LSKVKLPLADYWLIGWFGPYGLLARIKSGHQEVTPENAKAMPPHGTVVCGRKPMAPRSEMTADRGVNNRKSLCLLERLESAHYFRNDKLNARNFFASEKQRIVTTISAIHIQRAPGTRG
jgi:hypothetical protein